MTRAFLGLGSNLGDRRALLAAAVAALPDAVAVSPVYETDPVGGPEQGAFLNLVVELDTERHAPRAAGPCVPSWRRPPTGCAASGGGRGRWTSTSSGSTAMTVDEPDLVVPHPRMWERRFVLAPLRDLAPDLVCAEAQVDAAEGDVRLVGALCRAAPCRPAGQDGRHACDRRRGVRAAGVAAGRGAGRSPSRGRARSGSGWRRRGSTTSTRSWPAGGYQITPHAALRARAPRWRARSTPSGRASTRRPVGDRVLASCGFGGFAEAVVVKADQALRHPRRRSTRRRRPPWCRATPPGCSPSSAGPSLQEGESLLVLGAGGGVGLAAVDLGRALGARVIAAASSEAKREAALAAGAEAGDRLHDRGPQGPGPRAGGRHRGRRGLRPHRRRPGRARHPGPGRLRPLPRGRLRRRASRSCRPTRSCSATGRSSASSGAAGPSSTPRRTRSWSTACSTCSASGRLHPTAADVLPPRARAPRSWPTSSPATSPARPSSSRDPPRVTPGGRPRCGRRDLRVVGSAGGGLWPSSGWAGRSRRRSGGVTT